MLPLHRSVRPVKLRQGHGLDIVHQATDDMHACLLPKICFSCRSPPRWVARQSLVCRDPFRASRDDGKSSSMDRDLGHASRGWRGRASITPRSVFSRMVRDGCIHDPMAALGVSTTFVARHCRQRPGSESLVDCTPARGNRNQGPPCWSDRGLPAPAD